MRTSPEQKPANLDIQLADLALKALKKLAPRDEVVIPTGFEPVTLRLGI